MALHTGLREGLEMTERSRPEYTLVLPEILLALAWAPVAQKGIGLGTESSTIKTGLVLECSHELHAPMTPYFTQTQTRCSPLFLLATPHCGL